MGVRFVTGAQKGKLKVAEAHNALRRKFYLLFLIVHPIKAYLPTLKRGLEGDKYRGI